MTDDERRQRARNWLIDGRIADGYPLLNAPIHPPGPLKAPAPLPDFATRRGRRTIEEIPHGEEAPQDALGFGELDGGDQKAA